jgi:polyhydroxyalkanoate synthesis regulator phasin
MSKLEKLTNLLSEIKGEQEKLERNIEIKLQRLEDLRTLPLPQDDFACLCGELVDQFKSDYPIHIKKRLQVYIDNPLKTANWANGGFNPLGTQGEVSAHAMVYIFRDVIKKAIGQAAYDMEYPPPDQCGPSRADRKKEMAELEEEITYLTKQIETIKAARTA